MLKLIYKFASMQLKHKIQLTNQEKQIFDTLFNFRKQQNLSTIIRVAGGWVRDKIMGKQSNDIDLTLDNMKGQAFAQLISAYFIKKGSKIGTIIQNPELSKHLQTVTLQIGDRSIDIVNLRSQVYTQQSRIPQIQMGTPLQDAERRDLTINSLFYNIVTEQVEDYTGKGLQDIQNGIVRTPLQPYKSFKDDPLRILRVIRFAGRYKFKMVQQIFKAIQNEQMKSFLKIKVSKERIGQQLYGMLKDPHPVYCIQLLNQNGLWNLIFDIGLNSDFPKQKLIQSSLISITTLRNCLENYNKFSFKIITKFINNSIKDQKDKKQKESFYTQEQLRVNVILSALTLVYSPYSVIKKKNKQSLVQYILKQSLKFSNKQCKFAQIVNKSVHELVKLSNHQSIALHRIIKWLINIKQKWEIVFILAYSAFPQQHQQLNYIQNIIQTNNYQEIYLLPAFIDGTYITNTLKKKGQSVKNILQNSRIWRILNPDKQYQQFLQILHKQIQFFSNPNSYP